MGNNEIKNEIDGIKKWEVKFNRKDLMYETGKYRRYFQPFETMRSFGKSIYIGKTNMDRWS